MLFQPPPFSEACLPLAVSRTNGVMLLLVGHATRAIPWNGRLGGCVPSWRMTFDPSHVLLWAWSKERHCQFMWQTTAIGTYWQQLPDHTGNGVSCGVVGVVLVDVCAVWTCGCCVLILG